MCSHFDADMHNIYSIDQLRSAFGLVFFSVDSENCCDVSTFGRFGSFGAEQKVLFGSCAGDSIGVQCFWVTTLTCFHNDNDVFKPEVFFK